MHVQILNYSELDLDLDASESLSRTSVIYEQHHMQICPWVPMAQEANIVEALVMGYSYEIDLRVLPGRKELERFRKYMSSNDPNYNPGLLLNTLIVHYNSFRKRRKRIQSNLMFSISCFHSKNVFPAIICLVLFLVLCIIFQDTVPCMKSFFSHL